MADPVTPITPPPLMEPLTGIPTAELATTFLPRSCVTFNHDFASAGDAAAGDTEELNISMVLPDGFFYQLSSISLTALGATSTQQAAWSANNPLVSFSGYLEKAYHSTMEATELRYGVSDRGISWWISSIDNRVYARLLDGRNMASPPTVLIQLIQADTSSQILAVTFNLTAQFQQYTVEQGLSAILNTQSRVIG